MSERENMQATAKLRRSRRTQKQNGTQPPPLSLPANNDKEGWKVYWKAQGQTWRTEPEIDAERQTYLAERHSIMPDIKQGIYPFKDIKLSRADVEWLLATHENGRGPLDWNDESQRHREGLDLRGADLCQVDLAGLPLACLYGSLRWEEWESATKEQRNMAAIHLERANLKEAHLEKALLRNAYLEGANLRLAHLEEARLFQTCLKDTDFSRSHLEGVNFREANLARADLRLAYFDHATSLDNITLGNEKHRFVSLVDVHWGDVNLAVVDWASMKILGDEYRAHLPKTDDGKKKDSNTRLNQYRAAVRANRQLAVALRDQGLNEDAARFAYRAQLLQRKVFWYQRNFGQYLFSLCLDLLAGYGYKPWRSFLAYLLVIIAFATAYFTIGRTVGPPLSPVSAWVFSMTSFHGRGFFPGGIALDDPLTVLAALEAFVGLLIEVTFIATLTQRLFGK